MPLESRREIENVVTAGMNTIVMPETTPGIDMGSTTRLTTRTGFAPRSCAASMTDSQGRILLTQSLVEYIKLNKNAVIIGCGRYAEIWAEDSYERMVAAEDAAAINEQLLDLGV